MTTYYHDILRKLADAVEGVINALDGTGLTGVTIFKSASMSELTSPRVEILCSGEAEQIGDTITGNYLCEVRVRVICNYADTTRTAHNTRVAVVGDALFRDDFLTQVVTVSVSNFSMDWWYPKSVGESTDGSEFVTEFVCEAHCQPS